MGEAGEAFVGMRVSGCESCIVQNEPRLFALVCGLSCVTSGDFLTTLR